MKKVIKITLILTLVMLALAGCSKKEAAPAAGAAASAAGGAKLNIQWWHYFADTGVSGPAIDDIVAKYNALPNGKVTVVEQYLPRNDLLRRYALGVVSNDLPEIGMVDNPDSASFAAMGMWLDVTDLTAALKNPRFLEGPLNSGKLNGKQYTLPLRSNCLALWTNDEMLKAAGVTKIPETWDELLDACDKLQKTNPSNVYPFGFSAVKNEEGTFQFLPFLLSTGADWNKMDSPEAAKALTLVKTMVDKKYASPEVINWGQGDVQKQFAAGNISMIIAGSWQLPTQAIDAPNTKYTVSLIPKDKQFATSLGGENIGLTKAAADKREQVWDFIAHFMSLEVYVPWNEINGTLSANLDATNQYPNDPVMQGYIEQIMYSVPRGPHPKWPELSTAIQEAIQETITGVKPPARAGADAAAKIAQLNASLK